MLAYEEQSDTGETQIMDTGNWSYTYSRETNGRRPVVQQENRVAVAILMRHPSYALPREAGTHVDVHVTIVCAKLGGNVSYSGGDNDDGRFYPNGAVSKGSIYNGALALTAVGLYLGFAVGTNVR